MITAFILPPPDSFENRLRRTRLLRGFSGEEVAKKVGVSRTAYCRWEGGMQPLMRNMRGLAESLGVTLSWLAYGEGPMDISGPTRQGAVGNESDVSFTPAR